MPTPHSARRAPHSVFRIPHAARRAPHFSSRRGAALLVVVGMLSILFVLAVAFTILMRIERGASSNFRHMTGARQMLYFGLAQAIADIEKDVGPDVYPQWGGTRVVTNGAHDVTFPEEVLFSCDTNTLPGNVLTARVLSRTAMEYVPRNLHRSVETAVPEWQDVVANNNHVGRYAYVAVNVSGLLDANEVFKTNRWMGTSPREIQIVSNFPYEVVNTNDFVTARTADLRYETLKDLRDQNTRYDSGLNPDLLSHFEVYSRAPEMAPDGKPKLYIGGDIGTLLSRNPNPYDPRLPSAPENSFSNRLVAILSNTNVIGWDPDVVITPAQRALARTKRVEGFINSMVDYTSANTAPRGFNYPATKLLPMIQSVFWQPRITYTVTDAGGGSNKHTFTSSDTFRVGIFRPNTNDLPTANYRADLILKAESLPTVSTDGQLNSTFVSSLNFSTSADSPVLSTTNSVVYTANAPFLALAVASTSTNATITLPNSAVLTSNIFQIPLRVKVSLKRTVPSPDMEIDRVGVPADYTTEKGVLVTFSNFQCSSTSWVSPVPNAAYWAETIDPRFNWLTEGMAPTLNPPHWVTDKDLHENSSRYPGNTFYPMVINSWLLYTITANNKPFMLQLLKNQDWIYRLATTNGLHLLFDSMGMRAGDPSPWNEVVRDEKLRMYCANRPLLSVGELGYLPLNYWFTGRLYNHQDELNFGLVPDCGYHRFLDWFTLTPTNNPVRRGLVHANTRDREVLGAVLLNMPLRDWNTNAPSLLGTNQAAALANLMVQWTTTVSPPLTNVTDLGNMPFYSSIWTTNLQAANEFDRESVIRNAAGLLTTRHQLYTIIVRADSFSAKYGFGQLQHGNALGTAQAVFQVWRDPVADANGKHPCFVRLFKIINQ